MTITEYAFGKFKDSDEILLILYENDNVSECVSCNQTTDFMDPIPRLVPKSNIEIMTSFKPELKTPLFYDKSSYNSFLGMAACAVQDFMNFMKSADEMQSEQLDKLIKFISSKLKHLKAHSLTNFEEIMVKQEIISTIIDANRRYGLDEFTFELDDTRPYNELNVLKSYSQFQQEQAKELEEIHFAFKFVAYVGACCKFGECLDLEFFLLDSNTLEQVCVSTFITLNHNGMPTGENGYAMIANISTDSSIENLIFCCRTSLVKKSADLLSSGKILNGLIRKKSSANLMNSRSRSGTRLPVSGGICKLSDCKITNVGVESYIPLTSFRGDNANDWARPAPATLNSNVERIVFEYQFGPKLNLGEQYKSITAFGKNCTYKSEMFTNRYYISLLRGNFFGKILNHSIEVTCRVRNIDGKFYPNAIHRGSGIGRAEFDSIILPNCNQPMWMEMIHIELGENEIQNAHLFITFKEVSDDGERNVFAFSFMPLTQAKNVLLKDSTYELKLYKYNPNLAEPETYLVYPSGPNVLTPIHTSSALSIMKAANSTKKLPALPHQFFIKTVARSSYYSSDFDLVNFIQWKRIDAQSRSSLKDIFLKLQFVPPIEIANLAESVFLTFLDIFFQLGPHPKAALHEVVVPFRYSAIESLIYYFSVLENTMFSEKKMSVVELMNDNSKYQSNLPTLSILFLQIIEDSRLEENGKLFRKLVKVWGIIAKLMIKACLDDEELTQTLVDDILTGLQKFFSNTHTLHLPNQIIALSNLFPLLEALSIYPESYFNVFKGLIDLIDISNSSLREKKLGIIIAVLKADLYSGSEQAMDLREYACTCAFEHYKLESNVNQGKSSESSMLPVVELFYCVMNQLQKYPAILPIKASNTNQSGLSEEVWNRVLYIISKLTQESLSGKIFFLT
jgi:hypothetical protein